MRQRNEALVYNILPVHVAEHFMKNTKRSHDDLYSQSYAEVGVLFASMPNFSGNRNITANCNANIASEWIAITLNDEYCIYIILYINYMHILDFYSEESVNNQGLECLRFLNEVISDFDAVRIMIITSTIPRLLIAMIIQI